jgi:hypothetical protein
MTRPLSRVDVADLGRSRVAAELQRAGLEVSRPAQRIDGAHLIAHAALGTISPRSVSRPIRIQAASQSSFRVLRAWSDPQDALLVYTWHVTDPTESVTFALTYAEAERIVERMGWHHSASWRVHGGYGTTKAEQNQQLRSLLEPYRMTAQTWRDKIAGVA